MDQNEAVSGGLIIFPACCSLSFPSLHVSLHNNHREVSHLLSLISVKLFVVFRVFLSDIFDPLSQDNLFLVFT